VLAEAGRTKFAGPIAKATKWLLAAKPKSILDAAALLLAEPAARRDLLDFLLRSQTSDGGWGPQPHAPAEPFDTAVVILALHALHEPERTGKAIDRGRAFLIASQQSSGEWLETTRPAGAQSYAQRISTSAWATMALLAIDLKR
jgi:squalene cyclase